MPIINRIGGGGGGSPFATIVVKCPLYGNTVTCTNSSGYKDLSNIARVFYIRQGAVPFNCVVTLTDGTNTATKTISITIEGQVVNTKIYYNVPLAYQEVEYLESNGNQYIDTGYTNATDFSKVKTRVMFLENTAAMWGCTGRNSSPYHFSGFIYKTSDTSGEVYLGNNSPRMYLTSINLNEFYDFEMTASEGNVSYKINDNTPVSTTYTGDAICIYNIYLFARNTPSGANKVSGRLGETVFWSDDNTIVRDFIPCYRKSDSVAGMWDKENQVFYTNLGTGTFTVGPDIT